MFLPVCFKDMEKRGWQELDVILVTGDAYVDHPSYGASVISRVLESKGYRVGIIAQPDWKSAADFKKLGKPRLFFGVTSGNTDSMVANYSANKKKRKIDKYSPGNKTGLRPDSAVIVYSNRIREAFKDVPIVIGGIEASLRRFAHYDYWDDAVRRSILLDSRADILVYGMGEKQVTEIAQRLRKGEKASELDGIKGTCVVRKNLDAAPDHAVIPSFEEVSSSKDKFSESFAGMYDHMDPSCAKSLIQKHGTQFVIQFPPSGPLKEKELDDIYGLAYKYNWHPMYDGKGGVSGFETVRFSVTSHRGCPGECSFCSLFFHQGRIVQSRSPKSIIDEVKKMTGRKDFKGVVTDIGGPTANLYAAKCRKWDNGSYCRDKKCLVPEKCRGLELGYDKSLDLYRNVLAVPKVKHLFIGSGFRYDLLLDKGSDKYLETVCREHISGYMKVAPEHSSDRVLEIMNKTRFSMYEEFVKRFNSVRKRLGKKVFIVNYFISAHPGSTLRDALALAVYLRKRGINPEQIQDFLPSPMTLSTAIYYAGKDPFTREKVYVPSSAGERRASRALIQGENRRDKRIVRETLKELRADGLIGKIFQEGI